MVTFAIPWGDMSAMASGISKNPSWWHGYIVGAVLIILSSVHKYEFIKAWGIEAKIRKIKDTIDNGNELANRIETLLQQHRSLVETTAPPLIFMATKTGRWSSPMPPRLTNKLAMNIKAALLTNGTSDEKIREVLEPWLHDCIFDVTSNMLQQLRENATQMQRNWTEQLRGLAHDDLRS